MQLVHVCTYIMLQMGDDLMNELEISCEGLLTDKLTKSLNSSTDVIVDSKSAASVT